MDVEDELHAARAAVIADLEATDVCDAAAVSALEAAVAERRWWVGEWPDGAPYLAGLLAQDVQDALLEARGRWPLCPLHADAGDPHALAVEPELGPDPHWVCGVDAAVIAAVGALPPRIR